MALALELGDGARRKAQFAGGPGRQDELPLAPCRMIALRALAGIWEKDLPRFRDVFA